jgi:hypothetical protein
MLYGRTEMIGEGRSGGDAAINIWKYEKSIKWLGRSRHPPKIDLFVDKFLL